MIKQAIKKYLSFRGLKTDNKLVIICSDDWGSIRNRSKTDRQALIKKGFDMESNRFDRFDQIESNDDLERLFEILLKYKDHKGNHPVFTAVTNVANPDFDKIKESGFSEYYYEPFTQTLERYPNRNKVYDLYKKGIRKKIFIPQSHGREHLQVQWWMECLQNEDSMARKAFENEYFLLNKSYFNNSKYSGFGAAFDLWKPNEIEYQKKILETCLNLFEKLFGYKSIHFTPPSMKISEELEHELAKKEIEWLDLPKCQQIPTGYGKTQKRLNYLGKKNKYGVKYLTRNAVFEPNLEQNRNGVEKCLADIEEAFKNKMPAIISNHRAAFVGGINEKNRSHSLMALNKLLKKILKKWPDCQFITIRDLQKEFCE